MIRTLFIGQPEERRYCAEVPCDMWILCGLPTPGHTFWSTGNVNLQMTTFHASALDFSPIPPLVEVRGARLSGLDIELIVYDRRQAGSAFDVSSAGVSVAEAPNAAPSVPPSRGRTRGSGAFTKFDEPLLDRMALLIHEGSAMSPNGAALLVAADAKGGGTLESRAQRLAKAYRRRSRSGGSETL